MNDHQKPCPHCGYCPTCGRSNAAPYLPNPYTWQPYNPFPATVTITTPSKPMTVWYAGNQGAAPQFTSSFIVTNT